MPTGPFSRRLAEAIRSRGGEVRRVVTNGGDLVDWGSSNAIRPPRGADWEGWLQASMRSWAATDLISLGDANRYAAGALSVARALGVRIHVLEQGYLRPNWVTCEPVGVNANSTLPRSADFYRAQPSPPPFVRPANIAPIALPEAFDTVRYQTGAILLAPWFPDYVFPHRFGPLRQGFGTSKRYIGGLFQRATYRRHQAELILDDAPIFLALLQREGDNQFRLHSEICDNPTLIDVVVASFSASAPKDARLIIRNHPLDPAIYDLAKTTRRLAEARGVGDRVTFLDHTPLAPILARAAGVVAVNSTAAITAIEFGVPTKLLGRAMFDITGLVDQKPLDQFWSSPAAPDRPLFERFRAHIMSQTQIFGNFFNREHMRATAEALADHIWRVAVPISLPPTDGEEIEGEVKRTGVA